MFTGSGCALPHILRRAPGPYEAFLLDCEGKPLPEPAGPIDAKDTSRARGRLSSILTSMKKEVTKQNEDVGLKDLLVAITQGSFNWGGNKAEDKLVTYFAIKGPSGSYKCNPYCLGFAVRGKDADKSANKFAKRTDPYGEFHYPITEADKITGFEKYVFREHRASDVHLQIKKDLRSSRTPAAGGTHETHKGPSNSGPAPSPKRLRVPKTVGGPSSQSKRPRVSTDRGIVNPAPSLTLIQPNPMSIQSVVEGLIQRPSYISKLSDVLPDKFSDEQWSEFRRHLHANAKSEEFKFDFTLPYRSNDRGKIDAICEKTADQLPYFKRYQDLWPIRFALEKYVDYRYRARPELPSGNNW
ncbi:hypothetical protein BDP27DRAFT_1438214 [Rhodocollybia butyracea]|uniref:Uncharacterized protein n=1 Tax=Rhodocollybia butyracea TaxID=206335 RepID=A0A9P5P375_9AGAR|nr:hypothetical protein BDP27DRAFT_1438214 [Rhodocollybia butyracea]